MAAAAVATGSVRALAAALMPSFLAAGAFFAFAFFFHCHFHFFAFGFFRFVF